VEAVTVLIFATATAQAALLYGAALSWPRALPFINVLLTIAIAPLLASRSWQRHYGKLPFTWGRALRPADRARSLPAHHAGRFYELHRAVALALCGGGRHFGDRQSARHPAGQHQHPGARHNHGEPGRRHRDGAGPIRSMRSGDAEGSGREAEGLEQQGGK
jgi:hypothetical protein